MLHHHQHNVRLLFIFNKKVYNFFETFVIRVNVTKTCHDVKGSGLRLGYKDNEDVGTASVQVGPLVPA